jgi:PAS domain S-box-containing protein
MNQFSSSGEAGVTGRLLRHTGQYGLAVAAVAVSLAVRQTLSLILGLDLPVFLLFSPAVLAVACLAGMGPGLVSTVAAVLGTALWTYTSAMHLIALSPSQVISLLLFCVTGFLMSAFAGFYKRALQRAESARQESAAKEGDAHFSAMFHSSPISMSLVRMSNGQCDDVNQAHVDFFGYSREETVGHQGQDLNIWVTPHDRERFLEILSQDQRVNSFEADLRRKQGDFVTTLLSAEVISLGDEKYVWMIHNDITERKRTEEKFRLVVETAPMGLIIVNGQGQMVLINALAEKQFGYRRDELLSTSIEALIPERFRSAHEGLRTDYFADPQPRIMGKGRELLGVRKDGTEFPVEVGLTPIEMTDGNHVMASIIDITERRRIEGALRESDVALRTVVDAIPGMVLLMDKEGIVLAANETIAERFGMTANEMIGRQAYETLPPEVARSRRAYADECVRTGEPRHYEDGRTGRTFDNFVYPIKDGKGNVSRLAILSLDITDRKSSEERLKEQAALLDIASDAILAKDLDGRIVYWNKGAERLYGWSAEEAKGKRTFELLYAEEHATEGKEAFREVVEKGEWRGELHQKKKDSEKLIVEARWTLIRDDKGEPKGVLSVNSDITAKRSIEAQLLRSQRLESLGTLAGGIAHDLNNVLAPILMGIEGLSFRDPDDYVRNILSIIKTSAQRGANIVRQILNFARGMEGDFGEIQLKHVIREIESIIQETFPKSIALKADISKDLWPVNGDATQLHQVLMNLCVNARDAMPDGGWVAVSAENVSLDETYAKMNVEARPIDYVVLKVEDTGTGMPPSVLEKMFDPFFTTKEPGKGTGLGLSTVRSIVKSHGGFVTVYSELNKGTSIKVYIPAAEQEAQSKEAGPEEGIPMGEGETILVVDDEVSLRDITRQILESYSYKVLTAADGTEAITKFVEMKADVRLVITDMMMPYMDGAATIRAIRRIDPKARFIATSGLMASEYAKEAKGLGVQAFLAKPYTAEKLLHTLREVLEQEGGVSAS